MRAGDERWALRCTHDARAADAAICRAIVERLPLIGARSELVLIFWVAPPAPRSSPRPIAACCG